MWVRIVLWGAVASALAAGSAEAREWTVEVGARASVDPPYEGADRSVLGVEPIVSLEPISKVHRFDPPDDGATFALIDTGRIAIGPVARLRSARGHKDELTGLDKIHWAAEPGAFVNVWPTDWLRAHVEARRGVTGHSGWVGDAGLDLIYSSDRWDASIGPRVGFGNGRYMRTYFGVTAQEAARSPLISTTYAPEGGRRYTGLHAALAHHIGKHWAATVDAGYRRLSGKAARSPIVEVVGSRDQYSAGMGISYTFGLGR